MPFASNVPVPCRRNGNVGVDTTLTGVARDTEVGFTAVIEVVFRAFVGITEAVVLTIVVLFVVAIARREDYFD